MKKIITFLLAYIFTINFVLGQDKKEFYDTQHAFTQNFPVSPKQRKIISFELPEGTTAILYRITVGKKNQEVGESLINAVSSVPSPYAAAASAYTKLIVSLSSYEAKYYVFPDELNASKYKNGKQFISCKTTGELTSSTVKMLSNNCFGSSRYLYFGFNTNEMFLDYYVTLEVVPWVVQGSIEKTEKENDIKQNDNNVKQIAKGTNETINSSPTKENEQQNDLYPYLELPKEWNQELKEMLYNEIIGYIGKENESTKNVATCVIKNTTTKYTLEQYRNLVSTLSGTEGTQLIDKQINSCITSLKEKKLKEELKQRKILLGKMDSLNIIDDNKQIAENYKKILLLGFTEGNQLYNKIGWHFLLSKDFEQARIYLKKAESLLPEDVYVQINLAHLLLMQNNYDEAEDFYTKNKNLMLDGKKIKEYVKSDFQTFDRLGILPTEATKIKKKLGI